MSFYMIQIKSQNTYALHMTEVIEDKWNIYIICLHSIFLR